MSVQEAVALLMAGTNLGLALVVVVFQARLLYVGRGYAHGWRWLRVLLLLIGLAWAGSYGYVLMGEPGSPSDGWTREVIFRPVICLTLGVLAASAIARGSEGK